MITKEYIQEVYDGVLAEVTQILPLNQWKHQPMGLGFTDKKTKYGLATSDGLVLINMALIGTTATTKLDFVLRHEFAHLAVGLSKRHNRIFQRLEERFGVDPYRDLTEEVEQIRSRIYYKYTVLAHLENGEILDLGGVHRKTKRYTEYPKNARYHMSIAGIRVNRFELMERAVS
jgi:predicted SprT family Zn-dependent metalloprotease